MKHVVMIPGAMLLRAIVVIVVETGWTFLSQGLSCPTAVVGMVRIALTAVLGVMPHPATVKDLARGVSFMLIAVVGMKRTVVMMYGAIPLTRTVLFVVGSSLTQSWLLIHALGVGTGVQIVLHAVEMICSVCSLMVILVVDIQVRS